MNTDFVLEFRRNYIHVQFAPGYQVNSKGSTELWTEITKSCKTKQCNLILIEGTVDSWKMNLVDVFRSGIEATHIINNAQIAFCFVNCDESDYTKFFELVTENRGTNVNSFSDRHEALQWLGVEETLGSEQLESEDSEEMLSFSN